MKPSLSFCRPYIGVIVILALLVLTQGKASGQASDAKLWAGFTGKAELLEKLRFSIEQQQRLSADIGFEKAITDFELRLQPVDFFRAGVSYRTIATYDDGFWHRGSINLGLDHDLGRLGLSYLLRLQSTIRSNETVSVVRNKFGVQYDTGTTVTPSASFEMHYSTTDSEFREARLILGAGKQLSKKISIDMSYMLQSEFNKQMGETNHVLRLGLSYVFRKVKKGNNKPEMSDD